MNLEYTLTFAEFVEGATPEWPKKKLRTWKAGLICWAITEDETIVIIPKRAITDPAAMMALRSLIQTHIPKGTFLPFEVRLPVLPIANWF